MSPTESRDPVLSRIRCVLLDRDGTINVSPNRTRYVTDPSDFELEDGVGPAIARLNRAGIVVLVVTNQQGIGTGVMTEDAVARVHERMRALLAESQARVDAVFVCPHVAGTCACRKPLPGLLQGALSAWAIDPADAIMVGDAMTDIAAGIAAGTAVALVGDADVHADQLVPRYSGLGDLVDDLISQAPPADMRD
ncbi:MAG: D-glycero-alpha-D-manno-heptose-1,7-bisphosphate 7-phosphatase [Candidatus Nanopelagicales bacterium]